VRIVFNCVRGVFAVAGTRTALLLVRAPGGVLVLRFACRASHRYINSCASRFAALSRCPGGRAGASQKGQAFRAIGVARWA
jgi:hypothetical protein